VNGFKEAQMDIFVNVCVIVTTIFASGYLCYVILKPERF
jgi:K+-transporting ATPase KdpF subunit